MATSLLKSLKGLLLPAWAVCAAAAWGQPNLRDPHVGYLYPAGGRQGLTIEIKAGGQFLNGARKVFISGDGVRGSVLGFIPNYRPLNPAQRREFQRLLDEIREKREAEPGKEEPAPPRPSPAPPARSADGSASATLKDHPLLTNLAKMNAKELDYVAREFLAPPISFNRRQMNAQIGETVLIEIVIGADATPGERELRLETPAGLTNPLRFQVGDLPEVSEQEPNDRFSAKMSVLDVPALLNGQILPGDVDQFRFRATKGQQLVITAQARRLMPYLADAVPGWFQAAMVLYDAKGKEVAYADDYRFDPDPVIFYEVPKDGEYQMEIRDALYRGREDFVYRIGVGEQPFVKQEFPLGGQLGVTTVASVVGWNLPGKEAPLDTRPGGDGVRWVTTCAGQWLPNPIPYVVDVLPECEEDEPNDTAGKAQRIALPRIVNGRIEWAGDVDVYRFEGRAGDYVVAEVIARRLYSPLDSLLRLTDASGNVVAWNDDHDDGAAGLLTHQADSCLRAGLPNDGVYFVYLADAQDHGGGSYAYRLRLSAPRPDFALRATPSSVNVSPGRAVPISVHALRKDGFTGEIELELKGAPPGFLLQGGTIPGGRNSIRVTLTAPLKSFPQPITLRLEGRAIIEGKEVRREVVPAEDMMQAFAYRHLVPSRELLVDVLDSRRRSPEIALADALPIRLPAGGTAQVSVKTPPRANLGNVQLELVEPPKGVTLGKVKTSPGRVVFSLEAGSDAPKAGYADNLIVEAFVETEVPQKPGAAAKRKQRNSLGVLPAIPMEIVQGSPDSRVQ